LFFDKGGKALATLLLVSKDGKGLEELWFEVVPSGGRAREGGFGSSIKS